MIINLKIFLTYLLVFLFISLFLQSCKKKNEKLTISGYVYETNESTAVKDVRVTLLAKKITSGTWNSNYETINSAITGNDGKFSFTFDIVKVSGYRLTFDKTNYFYLTQNLSGDVVSKGEEYNRNYQINPVAYLRLHIKNVSPYNSDDYMSYYLVGGTSNGNECCSDSTSKFYGKSIDITRICKAYANQNITINWNYTKHNNFQLKTTNVTCTPLDTTSVDLFY